MLLLGIDVGTSAIKVSVVDANTGKVVGKSQYPETETAILAPQSGWAEQSPMQWWADVQMAIKKAHAANNYNAADIKAVGIAYQMHGLVLVNDKNEAIRNSIIWCDSRAVHFGDAAEKTLGKAYCMHHLLNSPGNFTASKLAWVKAHEPNVYQQTSKIMLPGDYIAMQLTGTIGSTVSALSEGIFWDFKLGKISSELMQHFGFDESLLPAVQPVFGAHGYVSKTAAAATGLPAGIPVSYKAGDQPNNALSLNVMQPGEIAATAGTSGVIYAVDKLHEADAASRINSFAHVNYSVQVPAIGHLLCINGCGIANKWIADKCKSFAHYSALNEAAAALPQPSLLLYPFGNGAERMLGNKNVGAHIAGIDFNRHHDVALYRATQQGIAFAFRYGLDIMKSNGLQPQMIKAGSANLFLSNFFAQSFANNCHTPVALYNNDGATGAAIGAGIGASIYSNSEAAFLHLQPLRIFEPVLAADNEDMYDKWLAGLQQLLQNS
jgi:xylulokinase